MRTKKTCIKFKAQRPAQDQLQSYMNESTENELNTKSILAGCKMLVWPFNGSKNSWSECLNVSEYSHAEFYSAVKLASPDLYWRRK